MLSCSAPGMSFPTRSRKSRCRATKLTSGAGLSAAFVQERIDGGAGVMPAGLVQGTREADVIAYVVSIGAAK